MKKFTALLCTPLLVLFFLCACGTDKTGDGTEKISETQNIFIGGGCEISEVFLYSGAFVENGSDEYIENVLALKIKNCSEKALNLLDFSISTNCGEFSFSAVTLFAGAELCVLEKNAAVLSQIPEITGVSLINAAPFENTPSLNSEKLEITLLTGAVNVRNISGEQLNNIYVYYKNILNGELFGGICYRLSVGSLAPGELRQLSVSRSGTDKIKAVFTSFEQ